MEYDDQTLQYCSMISMCEAQLFQSGKFQRQEKSWHMIVHPTSAAFWVLARCSNLLQTTLLSQDRLAGDWHQADAILALPFVILHRIVDRCWSLSTQPKVPFRAAIRFWHSRLRVRPLLFGVVEILRTFCTL
jgi:hypothetical protein